MKSKKQPAKRPAPPNAVPWGHVIDGAIWKIVTPVVKDPPMPEPLKIPGFAEIRCDIAVDGKRSVLINGKPDTKHSPETLRKSCEHGLRVAAWMEAGNGK